jgi:magnesium-transporting ATPase (P-type)
VISILNKLAKASLVTTSFAPVLITYAFVLWIDNESLFRILIILAISLLLVILCVSVLSIAKKQLQIIDFPVNSIKTADGEVLGYLVAYLIPFATLASDQINESVLLFIFGLFILVLTLFNYHFYEVTTLNNITYLLITKRDLRNTSSVKRVVQLTEYMVFDIMEE